jgi:hypothetical protein
MISWSLKISLKWPKALSELYSHSKAHPTMLCLDSIVKAQSHRDWPFGLLLHRPPTSSPRTVFSRTRIANTSSWCTCKFSSPPGEIRSHIETRQLYIHVARICWRNRCAYRRDATHLPFRTEENDARIVLLSIILLNRAPLSYLSDMAEETYGSG